MRLGRLAIVLAVGLLLAGTAASQPPGGFGGFGGLAGMIGRSQQLQDELKMDKEQVEKVTAALDKVREDLRDETAKLFDRDTPRKEREEIAKKLAEANAKALGTILKPEQLKRLRQIENQQAGAGIFTREDVQKALKLGDDQKEKIKGINEGLQKDLRELSSGGPGAFFDPETARKRQALQKGAMDNVVKVLKDDQKVTLKDLTGEPFELRRQGFGPVGFGARSQPGQVMSPALQDTLKLTAEQKKRLEELQKEVDGKLGKILTDEQKKQLKEMQQGPGGRPPGGEGDRPGRPE